MLLRQVASGWNQNGFSPSAIRMISDCPTVFRRPRLLLALSLDPVVGAIAAGNAVVLKPSEIASATSSLFAKLLGEYMDRALVQKLLRGANPETSALLVQKWDKIFYTGNGKVGLIVLAAAAKHITPVVLELGGKSPVFVDSNTNLTVTARRIIAGKWGLNNGQACISADHVITTKRFRFEVERLLQPFCWMFRKTLIMNEELFGPLLPIITVKISLVVLWNIRLSVLQKMNTIIGDCRYLE